MDLPTTDDQDDNNDFQNLPEWDLSALYQSPDDPLLESDLVEAETRAKAFKADFEGKLASISGAELGGAIKRFEDLLEIIYGAMSYAQLRLSQNVEDSERGRFYQGLQERVTRINTDTLFFTLELNRVPEDVLAKQLQDPKAAHYASWVRDSRVYAPYQLSDELEKALHEKSVVGRNSWTRLFDETMAGMRFDLDGEERPISGVLNDLTDTDGEKRKKAAKSLGAGFQEKAKLFALITNTLAKDKQIEDDWRGYESPMRGRNLANLVEDEVVEALVTSVSANYKNLSHRYYAMKAKWFDTDKLDYWDRNAPLPGDDSKKFTWDQARDTVLGAFGRFEPKISDIAKTFFDKSWIDAKPLPGKDSGAFAHPTVPKAHPFVLMNFHGKARDVMTLAHELGHGVHQVMAADQGTLMADTPLTLAETASVFGEMLTFRAMLDAETDPARKRVLLAGKVEDMMNTVVRQIAFHQFEWAVHNERRDGELSIERLCDIWMDVQTKSLGPAFKFDDEYKYFWTYIPHFIHSPFYVYAYAFGDGLVNALYAVYEENPEGFQDKYFDMLKAGGSMHHTELLAPFGLDATDPKFWDKGLGMISGFIDELEAMEG